VILLELFPALAACFAPITAFWMVQLFTSLRILALREELVLNKNDDTVTATYYPSWSAPQIK